MIENAFTPDPRWLCDEMLGRLARYLRAAGYDTALATGGLPDRDLLALAAREQRVFLTCDRHIADHNAARGRAVILHRASLAEAAAEISRTLHVDWMHAPFTRCLVDNTPLQAVAPREQGRVPADVAHTGARSCPTCGRVYWSGSHHRRMQQRLDRWARGVFEEPRL